MEIKSSKTKDDLVAEKMIMLLPGFLMTIFLIYFVMRDLGIKHMNLLYTCCFIGFFLGLMWLASIYRKIKYSIPGILIVSGVLMLIYRDLILTVNIAIVVLSIILFYILSLDKIKRFGFLIFMIGNITYWCINNTNEKIVVICLIIGGIYSLGRLFKKEVDYNYVVIMGMLLIIFMSFKDKPLRVQWVEKLADYVTNSQMFYEIEYLTSDITGDYNAYTGYSEVASLTGSISKGKARRELIFKRSSLTKNVYLKGAEFRTITKNGFEDKRRIAPDYNNWFVLFVNGLMDSGFSTAKVLCFVRIERAEVKYDYIRTDDIIYPLNLLKIDKDIANEKRLYKGYKYNLIFMMMDYGNPYFLEFADHLSTSDVTKKINSYNDVKVYMNTTFHFNLSEVMSESEYNEIADNIRNEGTYDKDLGEYMDISMSTPKIKKLVEELTVDCKNDYEKAKVIEGYLRKYKYDGSVNLRGSENYIEDFLFKTKSGYCIHYAGAMVLMLREAGIPARYVSGYIQKGDKHDIMNTSAHAWVEGYIDGMGWVSFEPTTNEASSEESSWHLQVNEEHYKPDEEKTEFDWENYYKNKMEKVDQEYEKIDGEDDKTNDGRYNKSGKKGDSERVKVMKMLFKYLVLFLGTAGIFFLMIIGIKALWYKHLSSERKLHEIVKKRCKAIEKKIKDDEQKKKLRSNNSSIYDYLNFEEDEEANEKLKKIFDKYYLVRFRGDKVSEEEIKELGG